MASTSDIMSRRLADIDKIQLKKVIKEYLKKYYTDVNVEWVECPDLSESYNLAAKGLCGNEAVIQVGKPGQMPTETDKKKFKTILNDINKKENVSFLMGKTITFNDEKFKEFIINKTPHIDKNKVITLSSKKNECIVHSLITDNFQIPGTFFKSDGQIGQVLKVKCVRQPQKSPTTSMSTMLSTSSTYITDKTSADELVDRMQEAIKEYKRDDLFYMSGIYQPICSHWYHDIELNPWESELSPEKDKYGYSSQHQGCCIVHQPERILTIFNNYDEANYDLSKYLGYPSLNNKLIQVMNHHSKNHYFLSQGHNIQYEGYFCPVKSLHYFI